MQRQIRTYSLWFAAILMVGIGAFTRINKKDFYHLYFKVIADISDRNSQHIDKNTQAFQVKGKASKHQFSVSVFLPSSLKELYQVHLLPCANLIAIRTLVGHFLHPRAFAPPIA